jgi:hypothetical protein
MLVYLISLSTSGSGYPTVLVLILNIGPEDKKKKIASRIFQIIAVNLSIIFKVTSFNIGDFVSIFEFFLDLFGAVGLKKLQMQPGNAFLYDFDIYLIF